MKKLSLLIGLLAIPFAVADYGGCGMIDGGTSMIDYGMISGNILFSLIGLVYFALAAFLFSVIFWLLIIG